MSRLIIVSNRVQRQTPGAPANQGGLAVALASALKENDGIWCGWSGETVDRFTGELDTRTVDGVTTATIDLEAQDVDEYYNGFANRTLWPLLHHRTDLAEHERDFAGGYERVNARFADTIAPLVQADDLVWVHDYHLFPLGRDLRQKGVANRIGFFLHTPWPPTQLLLSLPHHKRLVESLFDYDLIGFQTEEWLDNFLHYLTTELGLRPDGDGIWHHGGRSFKAIACPIGIDGEEFAELARTPAARYARYRMKQSATGRSIIVGVDRLDYSKGLEERFLGYERFLANHPEQHSEVFLLQIAPPSRGEVGSYQAIRSTLDGLSGRINGNYADIDWVPIRYVNQGYPRAKLAGIYRAASVGLVTPLRDGMNLVAKEYVAAQDEEDPGVLVLSRFAGAAAQMADAVLVNPYSADDVADAVQAALTMKRGERVARWEALMHNVVSENVTWWRTRFTEELARRPVRA